MLMKLEDHCSSSASKDQACLRYLPATISGDLTPFPVGFLNSLPPFLLHTVIGIYFHLPANSPKLKYEQIRLKVSSFLKKKKKKSLTVELRSAAQRTPPLVLLFVYNADQYQ